MTNSSHGLKNIEAKLDEFNPNINRILFTGGAGLLSLNWAMTIRERYAVVLGLHNKSVALRGCQHHQIDLESVQQLINILEQIKPNVVIHTVGLTSIERCEADPDLAFHVNTVIAEVVAKASFYLGLPLVHISTDHIFNGEEPLSTEIKSTSPVNVYGKTKAEAEGLVLMAHPEALVIRTNFFGWGTSYRKSFSDFIIGALRAGEQIVLFDDVYYTPILVESLAITVHDLIDKAVHGVINVVGDERISKYEFGIKLARQFGLDCEFIKRGLIGDVSGLVQRPNDMSLSNKKACDILGRKLGSVDEYLSGLLRQAGEFQEIRRI